MNQLLAIAFGGSLGAVLRYLVSTGIYQWLGRGFPYGTLVVNVIGSFLIGLLTESLVLQRVAISQEYRAAILVGFIGAFTTFSTFSLETLYLLEQGSLGKAALNTVISVFACLLAVWLGLWCGRALLLYSGGVIHWQGILIPYALMVVNGFGAFLIGLLATLILQKMTLPIEYSVAIIVVIVGFYVTFSGLYLLLFLLEQGVAFADSTRLSMGLLMANTVSCLLIMGLGFWFYSSSTNFL